MLNVNTFFWVAFSLGCYFPPGYPCGGIVAEGTPPLGGPPQQPASVDQQLLFSETGNMPPLNEGIS